MKAALVTEWGSHPVYTDVPEPAPRDGAEVVTVEASALTNLTRALISGKHYASKEIQLPAVPGVDGVARLADGRRIYTGALGYSGMMAERALVDPRGGIVVPEHVDSVTAAALPNPGISAWTALAHAAAVKPGDHVLVLGATGVTGSMAVQLATTMFGAETVVAAGRNTERLAWLRSASAGSASAACRPRCWSGPAPGHCPGCSPWSPTVSSNCAPSQGHWPTSPRCGQAGNPRAPAWC